MAIQKAPSEGSDKVANAQADPNLGRTHMFVTTFSDIAVLML